MIDRSLLDDALDVIDAAQTFERLEMGVVPVAQIADDPEAQLTMRSHPLDDRASQLAASSDKDAIEILPRAMTPLHGEANEHPSGDHKQAGADHENRQGRPRVRDIRASRAEPKENSRQNHRAHNGADCHRQPLLRFRAGRSYAI